MATANYRKRVILFATKYMVTHMAILQKLYNAIESCENGDLSEGIANLDTAVAYYTGSFEGTQDGGSFDGSLSFFLARRMCIFFDTCSQSDNALVNERMISLFYSAQGELDTRVSLMKSFIWWLNDINISHYFFYCREITGMRSSQKDGQAD